MVEKLIEGRWYVWKGSETRPELFNDLGEMDYVLHREPVKCIAPVFEPRNPDGVTRQKATLKPQRLIDIRIDYTWTWEPKDFEEIPAPVILVEIEDEPLYKIETTPDTLLRTGTGEQVETKKPLDGQIITKETYSGETRIVFLDDEEKQEWLVLENAETQLLTGEELAKAQEAERKCDDCGEIRKVKDMKMLQGNWYCKSHIVKCQDCGSYEQGNEAYETAQGKIICRRCMTDFYYTCDDCEAIVSESEINEVYNGDRRVCNRCYRHYIECEGCGEYIHEDEAQRNYCNQCAEEHEGEEDEENCRAPELDTFVKIAELKPEDTFNILGMELEFIRKDVGTFDYEHEDIACLGFTEDGSLSSGGKEALVPPFRIGDMKAEEKVHKAMDHLNKEGKVNKTCGYHCHLFFHPDLNTTENIKKLMFGYIKAEDFLFSMVPESRRDSPFCRKLSKEVPASEFMTCRGKNGVWSKYYKKVINKDCTNIPQEKYIEPRYYYLNLHSIALRNTVEIRLHSGTVNFRKAMNWARINANYLKYLINPKTTLYTIAALTNAELQGIMAGGDEELGNYINERKYKFRSKTKKIEDTVPDEDGE